MTSEPDPGDPRWMLLRFILVGGFFALVYGVSTAVLIDFLGFPPFWTSVVVYLLCIPAAFTVQKRFTFRMREVHRAGFFIYGGMQLLSLAAVSTITTRFVTGDVILDSGLFLVTGGVAAVLSFLVSRFFAFRPPV